MSVTYPASLQVHRCKYLSKMHFIKNNLVGVGNLVESSDESQHGQNGNGQPIVPF